MTILHNKVTVLQKKVNTPHLNPLHQGRGPGKRRHFIRLLFVSDFDCHPERQWRVCSLFDVFILSEVLRSLCSLRMIRNVNVIAGPSLHVILTYSPLSSLSLERSAKPWA